MVIVKKLPHEIWLDIISYIAPEDIVTLEKTCKLFRNKFEELWKEKCKFEFPWFFWLGQCERKAELKLKTTCKACQIQGDNPYHPLLGKESHNFKRAYLRIYFGRYTGMLQALNCGRSREMSAFTGLVSLDLIAGNF
jgi:hypothetical protein